MSDAQRQVGGGGTRKLLLGGVVGAVLLVVCAGAVPVTGILAAIAIPNFIVMQLRAKRAEVPGNVNAIKTAEIAYDASYDKFVACGEPYAGAPHLGKTLRDFSTDPAAACFRGELLWQPDGLVRGSYWVTVSGDDFEVHGICDADGDGVFAEYVATMNTNAMLVTPDDVY